MKRLFFALLPGDEARNQIDCLNQSIQPLDGKRISAENLHVTLVFLGHIDSKTENMIRNNVSNIHLPSFTLHFDQLEFWQKPKVLCLTMQPINTPLLELVEALKNSVQVNGFTPETRAYRPHITLARKVHKHSDIDKLSIEWSAKSFCLLESCRSSNTVQYPLLQQWDLN